MGILKELYYGHGDYFGESRIDTPEFHKSVAAVADREEKLLKEYPNAHELFMQYQEAQANLNSMTEYEMFAAGFRTGAQLMLEMLGALK